MTAMTSGENALYVARLISSYVIPLFMALLSKVKNIHSYNTRIAARQIYSLPSVRTKVYWCKDPEQHFLSGLFQYPTWVIKLRTLVILFLTWLFCP